MEEKTDGLWERFLSFSKDPYTIAIICILIIAVIIRTKFLFQESLWVDETHYMVYGSRTIFNPWEMLTGSQSNNIQFPLIIIGILSLFFSSFIAGRLMALFFVLVGILVAYLIGKELGRRSAGLFAALLLTFNPFHWFVGSRALVDVPVATMISVFILCFLRYLRTKKNKDLFILFTAGTLAVLSKLTGLIVVVIALLYLLYIYTIAPFFDQSLSRSSFLFFFKSKSFYLGLFILSLLAYNIGYEFLSILYSNLQFRWDYLSNLESLLGARAIPGILWIVLLILSSFLFFCVYFKRHRNIILFIEFSSFLGIFIFLSGIPDPRYQLPLLVPFYLMVAFFLEDILSLTRTKSHYLYYATLAIIALFIIPTYFVFGKQLIFDKYNSYTGYGEAGSWLKENTEHNAVIYTMSTSWGVLHTGKEVVSKGGTIANSAQFETSDYFVSLLNSTDRPFYLVYDIWESWAQPRWMTEWMQNPKQWQDNGFKLVHVVKRSSPQQETKAKMLQDFSLFKKISKTGTEEIPAIFIFKREGT